MAAWLQMLESVSAAECDLPSINPTQCQEMAMSLLTEALTSAHTRADAAKEPWTARRLVDEIIRYVDQVHAWAACMGRVYCMYCPGSCTRTHTLPSPRLACALCICSLAPARQLRAACTPYGAEARLGALPPKSAAGQAPG